MCRPSLRAAPVVVSQKSTLDASLSPKDAKDRLSNLGIAFEPESFFKRVDGGDAKVVSLFLSAEMPTSVGDYRGRTPLMVAIDSGQAEIVDLLLAAGADPNDAGEHPDPAKRYGQTPIMKAVDRDDLSIIKALLAAGADVNQANKYGVNAFDSAIGSNKAELVPLLIEYGADVNKTYSNGYPCISSPAPWLGSTERA